MNIRRVNSSVEAFTHPSDMSKNILDAKYNCTERQYVNTCVGTADRHSLVRYGTQRARIEEMPQDQRVGHSKAGPSV